MKPGYQTTEFWISVLSALLGVLVSIGVLTPEQSGVLTESATEIAGAVITALSVIGYNISRGLSKMKEK